MNIRLTTISVASGPAVKRTTSLALIGWALVFGILSAVAQTPTPSTPKQARVVVIANTDAEADELMAVLDSKDVRPASLLDGPVHHSPKTPPLGLRGFYENDRVKVEFW